MEAIDVALNGAGMAPAKDNTKEEVAVHAYGTNGNLRHSECVFWLMLFV